MPGVSERVAIVPAMLEVDDEIDGDTMNEFPTEVLGVPLKLEEHALPSGVAQGCRVTCTTHGPACRRFRSLKKDVHLYGHHACVCFLKAWLIAGRDLSVAEHHGYTPTRAQIEACI